MTNIKAQTRSGKLVSLTAPRADEIDFADVAFQLSHQPRFNGAAGAYSVAQHCIDGADELFRHLGAPYIAAAFLLHDAHKFILGDLTTPVEREITRRNPQFIRRWNDLKFSLDMAIHRAAGVDFPHPPKIAEIVRDTDARMLATELRDLVLSPPEIAAKPYEFSLTPARPDEVAYGFLERLRRWTPGKQKVKI